MNEWFQAGNDYPAFQLDTTDQSGTNTHKHPREVQEYLITHHLPAIEYLGLRVGRV